MPILNRYLLREASVATLGVTLIVMLIMLANLLARSLSAAADGSLPSSLIPAMMGFNAIKLLIYVLPVGLFIGLMFALGRLSRDSELTVLRSCGFGPRHISLALLWLAIPVSLLTAGISLYGYPALQQIQTQLIAEARSQQVFDQLPVGRFIEDPSGRAVLYIGSKDKGGYRDIFAFNEPTGKNNARQKPGVEMAPFGTLKTDSDGHRYVVLEQGRRVQGIAGEADWSVIDYQTHEILIPGQGQIQNTQENKKNSLQLLKSSLPADQAEFFYRLSQALTVIILALITVPLAQAKPRSGRYGRLFWAFLLYALYFNLIALMESAIKQGELSMWQALGLTHGTFILLWIGLLWWMSGGSRRLWRRLRGRRHGYA